VNSGRRRTPRRRGETLSHLEQILCLIGQYGYLILFFGIMLESTGVPRHGETILIAAGVMVQQGQLVLQ
jgi:membrane protein DedA with SNARE-associated domain